MHPIGLLLAPVLVSAAAIQARSAAGAAYFLDNNPAGASIISLEIADDGTVSKPVRTSTGGKGLMAFTGGAVGAPPTIGAGGKLELYTPFKF